MNVTGNSSPRSDARLGILIQARMSSHRLPGKVLKPLAGRPMIQHVWERCCRVSSADLVSVITSGEASDDPLSDWGQAQNASVFRGPLEDVAARFVAAADNFDLDGFVRVNADSPLLDARLIEQGISLYKDSEADLVTNVLRRTYPAGMSVEVLDRPSYMRTYEELKSADDREHVTRYYYRNPELFQIEAFESALDYGDKTLAIDTPEDFERIEQLMTVILRNGEDDDWESVCKLAELRGLLARREDIK